MTVYADHIEVREDISMSRCDGCWGDGSEVAIGNLIMLCSRCASLLERRLKRHNEWLRREVSRAEVTP